MQDFAVSNQNGAIFDYAQILQKHTATDAERPAECQQLAGTADQSVLFQTICL